MRGLSPLLQMEQIIGDKSRNFLKPYAAWLSVRSAKKSCRAEGPGATLTPFPLEIPLLLVCLAALNFFG
jgi:hypothetical protein